MSTIQGSTAPGSTIHGNAPNAINFASFRNSGDYSDCIIKTQTGEHEVHKIVLCSQSPFFAKAVKKNTFEEGRTGVINMEHDNPQSIAATLDYLYQGHYKCTLKATNEHVLYHIDVFVLADKLGIIALKAYALQFIKTTLSTLFGSPPYAELIKHAYNSAPPGSAGKGLRALVVEEIKGQGKALFQSSNGGNFRETLIEIPELAADLAESLTNDLHQSSQSTSRRHGNHY